MIIFSDNQKKIGSQRLDLDLEPKKNKIKVAEMAFSCENFNYSFLYGTNLKLHFIHQKILLVKVKVYVQTKGTTRRL